MAVYGTSLQRLARLAASRPWQEEVLGQPSPEATEQAAEESADAFSPYSPAATPGEQPADLSQAVTALLDLPKERIESLLSEWGDSGGKALLVLIHRLAALEEQLAELRDRRPPRPTPSVPKPAAFSPVARPQAIVYDAGKSDLLEQVFQKNLSLRRMDLR